MTDKNKPSLSIMLVDNEDIFIQLFKHQCHRAKGLELRVDGFTDWSEAKKHLTPDIDILILDYFLNNDLLALDIVREIRKTDAKLPIIIITATATNEITAMVFRAGADDLIEKNMISSHSIEGIMLRTYHRSKQTTHING